MMQQTKFFTSMLQSEIVGESVATDYETRSAMQLPKKKTAQMVINVWLEGARAMVMQRIQFPCNALFSQQLRQPAHIF
jgi:hypothetical protein